MIAEAEAPVHGYRMGYDLTKSRSARERNVHQDPISVLEQELATEAVMPEEFSTQIPTSIDMDKLRQMQTVTDGPEYEHMGYGASDVASNNGYHVSKVVESDEFQRLFAEFLDSLRGNSPSEAMVMKIMYGEGVVRTVEETAKYLKVSHSAVDQSIARSMKKLRHPAWSRRFAPFFYQ